MGMNSRSSFPLFAVIVPLAVFASGALPAWAVTLQPGTEIVVRLENQVVPSRKSLERFSALVVYPVFADGQEVLPAGCEVEGRVRGSKKRIQLSPQTLTLPNGRRLDFNAAVEEIDRKQLRAALEEGTIERSGSKADTTREAAEIGMTGAGIGAMTTRSAKGAGIGAAVGVAAVLIGRKIASSRAPTVIPAGTQLTMSLARPLEILEGLTEAPVSERRPRDPDDRRPILRRYD